MELDQREDYYNMLLHELQEELHSSYADHDQQSILVFQTEMRDLGKHLRHVRETDSFNESHLERLDDALRIRRKAIENLRSDAANNRSFGVPFVDLSDTNGYKRVQWSITAPAWRKAVRGMCLEGLCENKMCVAYGQQVIIGIGMQEFDLLIDPSSSTTPCPMCKQYVEPITCAFNNCRWRWKGKKQIAGQPPLDCSDDWRQADNAYHYFDQTIKGTATTSGTCIWRMLKIEAKALS